MDLATERCVACRKDSPRLEPDELAAMLPALPGWTVIERDGVPRLERVFRFDDFAGSLALAVRIGALAEAEGHHPALLVEWRRLTVAWWTQAIGGLHRNDPVMAAKTDRLAAVEGAGPGNGSR